MKHKMMQILSVIVLTQPTMTFSQTASYQTPIDARSIGMGESFVAVDGNVHALAYNPAGLARVTGIRLAYSQREFDWSSFSSGMKYHTYAIAVASPVAVFGFSYSRFSLGKTVTTNSSGVITGEFFPYEHTFSLGATHRFESGLSIGAAVKTYNFVDVGVRTPNNPGGFEEVQKRLPVLFDVGLNYGVSLLQGSSITDNFSLALSLQHFGSNFIIKDRQGNQLSSEQLTRYLRAGFAYSLAIDESIDDLTPLHTMITFEYRKELNTYSPAHSDFYGFGIEMKVFDILAVRGGGFLSNITSIYGVEKRVARRYGFGLHIPFRKAGIPAPLTLLFEYAAIPLNKNLAANFFTFRENKLNVFSIALQFDNEIF